MTHYFKQKKKSIHKFNIKQSLNAHTRARAWKHIHTEISIYVWWSDELTHIKTSTLEKHVYVCICLHTFIRVHIVRDRKTERERNWEAVDRGTEREREREREIIKKEQLIKIDPISLCTNVCIHKWMSMYNTHRHTRVLRIHTLYIYIYNIYIYISIYMDQRFSYTTNSNGTSTDTKMWD